MLYAKHSLPHVSYILKNPQRKGSRELDRALDIQGIQGRETMRELDYTGMGARIRQVRKAKGWSQDALAKKCGISMSFLGHIERGTRIMSLETFVGICEALDADADEILWGVAHLSNAVLDLWKQPEPKNNRMEAGNAKPGGDAPAGAGSGQAGADSYSMYVRIMKSVAEIMNGA